MVFTTGIVRKVPNGRKMRGYINLDKIISDKFEKDEEVYMLLFRAEKIQSKEDFLAACEAEWESYNRIIDAEEMLKKLKADWGSELSQEVKKC